MLVDAQKQQAETYSNVSLLQLANNKAAIEHEGVNGRLTEMLESVTQLTTSVSGLLPRL